MQRLKIVCANVLWFIYNVTTGGKWKKSISTVTETQERYLLELIKKNSNTEFGMEYGFGKIHSVIDFQKMVPQTKYDDLAPYIERIAEGKQNVLTAEKVLRFGVSSGSTKASKLLPYTNSLINEFTEGINPWLAQLVKKYPKLLFGKTYWSVTPVGQTARLTSGGIPIGFDDERKYFGKFAQWVLNTVQIAPSELALIKDIDSFWYVTLRFLVEEKSLSWISIWNPTFLSLCLDPLKQHMDSIIRDIREGTLSVRVDPEIENSILSKIGKNPKRGRELEKIWMHWKDKLTTSADSKERTFYEALWPHLKVISCWAHVNAKLDLQKLYKYFPRVTIQPKGLIATEAFVSFPFDGESSALSLTSHFFEFEEMKKEGSHIKLAHELQVGEHYSVIVTTSGGLYRYRLGDVIEVLGFEEQCPLIRFLGKQDKVVDIRGEKMNEEFVAEVLHRIFSIHSINPKFFMLAPQEFGQEHIAYTLFIEQNGELQNVGKLREQIENEFEQNYHYKYCRYLRQLLSLEVFLIDPNSNSEKLYISVCEKLGQRIGDIKATVLHPHTKWADEFKGKFIT